MYIFSLGKLYIIWIAAFQIFWRVNEWCFHQQLLAIHSPKWFTSGPFTAAILIRGEKQEKQQTLPFYAVVLQHWLSHESTQHVRRMSITNVKVITWLKMPGLAPRQLLNRTNEYCTFKIWLKEGENISSRIATRRKIHFKENL